MKSIIDRKGAEFIMDPNLNGIPEELKRHPSWVNWTFEERKGKLTKPPIDPKNNEYADTTDPSTWATYDQALKRYKECENEKIRGIGFVLSNGYSGADLDHCRNIETGEVQSWAKEIITQLRSYTEITPSNEGIRIWTKGKLPKGKRVKGGLPSPDGGKNGKIEIYDSGRFYTVTGRHLDGTPSEIHQREEELRTIHRKVFGNGQKSKTDSKPGNSLFLSDADLINKAMEASNGDKFRRLWEGDISEYSSQSEADLAFCSMLAFWARNNEARIDRLFRQSKLMRAKWDEKHYGNGRTYGQGAIEKVIGQTTETYSGLRSNAGAPVQRAPTENESNEREIGKNSPFNPRKEAEVFLNSGHFVFMYEAIHEFDRGYYRFQNDRTLMDRMGIQLDTHRDKSRLGKVREVLETAKNILSAREINLNSDPNIINVGNGLLDIRTMTLSKHDPSTVFLYQINANYDPFAECPLFKQFLSEVLVDHSLQADEDLIKIVQEFIGYCFYIPCPFDKALMLYGEGSNGKNVLIYILNSLFKGFVSNVHFEEIGDDRFASADLAGKLLNISGELSASARLRESEVKKIISGEPIRAQRKHQKAFDFSPFAKHIITTNNLPFSVDQSFGYFRRWKVIPFWQTFLNEKDDQKIIEEFNAKKRPYKIADPFLEEKLDHELDGVFLWAMEGLKRLLKTKGFSYSSQIEDMRTIFQMRSSTVEAFAEKNFDTSEPTASILLQTAYKKYVEFCRQLRFPAFDDRNFAKELRKLGYVVEPGAGNKSCIKGAAYKEVVGWNLLSQS